MRYFTVGASQVSSDNDIYQFFISNGYWASFHDRGSRFDATIDSIQIGDVLAIKLNRGRELMEIRALGIVTGKINRSTFNVNWVMSDIGRLVPKRFCVGTIYDVTSQDPAWIDQIFSLRKAPQE